MKSLMWQQVDAWRLARNHLTVPAPASQLADVVRNACGIQAQVLSAAELALSARIPDLRRPDFQAALWAERSLVKTYGPRGTVHLLAADDVALHMAALAAHPRWKDNSWRFEQDLDPAEAQALLDAFGAALDGQRLTREELAVAVAERVGPWANEPMRSAWGTLLSPAAVAGKLCFGPSRGNKVTFVRVDQWIGSWSEFDPQVAMTELIRRFLAAYGPTSTEDLAGWLALRPVETRSFLEVIGDELEEVRVEGRQGWLLAEDAGADWPVVRPVPTLKLLPQYDSYILGHRQRERLVPGAAKALIAADPKGRLESVVGVSTLLVDGVVGGLWRRKLRGRRVDIAIEPTVRLTKAHQRLLDREVARVGAYLGVEPSRT